MTTTEARGVVPYVADDLAMDCTAAPCACNGYADRLDESPTTEEIARYDCGRPYACCTAVFKCRLCGLRFVGQLNAPETW